MSAVKKMRLNFHKGFLKFTFEIQNFKAESNIRYYSDEFNIATGQDQSKWRVLVYAKAENEFGVLLSLLSDHEVNARYSFKFIDLKNEVIKSSESLQSFKKNNSWGARFDRSVLLKAPSPDHHVVRIVCEIELIDDSELATNDSSFFENLQEISSGDFFDLTIKVDNRMIKAHRLIVSAASPVLYEKIKALNQTVIPLKLDGFSFETIQEVINFIYKKEFRLNGENSKNILKAANELKITKLQIKCETYLCENVTVQNGLDSLAFLDPNENKMSWMKTIELVGNNIDLIISKKEAWQKFIEEHPNKFKHLFQKVFKSLSKELSDKLKLQDVNISNNVLIKTEDNIKTVSKDIAKLYKSMLHADVDFEVDGKFLKAHKAILCCRSPVFTSMFNHDTLEAKTNTIKIQDASYDTMKNFLEFIYCGKVANIDGSAVELFTVADKYDFPELKDLCSDYMKGNMTVGNVVDILTMTNLHSSLQAVKSRAFYFILQNVEKEIAKWEEFAEQNPKILDKFLVQALELRKTVAKKVQNYD